jgi:hypothetical protein
MKFSLTPANLERIRNGELPGALWEYYLAYSRQVESDPARQGRFFSSAESRAFDNSLPYGLRLVHSLIRFDSDILNGGIAQYFGNHCADEVFEDLKALKTIGAVESAAILEEAISIFSRLGWPSGTSEAFGPHSEPDADSNRLDDARCNEDSSLRDNALLDGYLRQHLDECVLPVEVESEFIAEWLDQLS